MEIWNMGTEESEDTMKNHKMVDGRLLQTNKKFSALKESQKAKIAEWTYEAYRAYFLEQKKLPGKNTEDVILESVFAKIEAAQIWIPDGEIYQYYHSRRSKLLKRLQKEFSEQFLEEQRQKNDKCIDDAIVKAEAEYEEDGILADAEEVIAACREKHIRETAANS